ncbi:MAG: DUF2182 domain-containing protein [Hyphomicrobiaceae bacterium]
MSLIINQSSRAEEVLRRDKWITLAGLVIVTFCSWSFLLSGAGTGMSMQAMSTWSFPPPSHGPMVAEWTLAYWGIMLVMWWGMMIAMMTPSATPVVLLYGRVSRHAMRKGRIRSGVIPTASFLAGYLIAWLMFSAIATVLQWSLEHFGIVHGMFMWSISTWLSAALLITAGLYQFSGIKRVCLEHCRSPAEYLSRHWRDGRWGALRMGISHGSYCLGCCWVLMTLLFVGGAMNLVWIAGLSMVVMVEKFAPFGHRVAQVLGTVMICAGIWVLMPVA